MNNQNMIHKIKEIKMTAKEKAVLFERIMSSPARVRSPLSTSSYFSSYVFTFSSRPMAYVVATLLVVVLTGGATALAAEASLPGDVLYPVKVSVTEPIRDIVKISPEAKAEWEVEKVNRRLAEAQVLSDEGRLDDSNTVEIETKIREHAKEFSVQVVKTEHKNKKKNQEQQRTQVVENSIHVSNDGTDTPMQAVQVEVRHEDDSQNKNKNEGENENENGKKNRGEDVKERIFKEAKSKSDSSDRKNIEQVEQIIQKEKREKELKKELKLNKKDEKTKVEVKTGAKADVVL